MASKGTRLKVYQAIARALSDNGIDKMFGLIGGANLYMADSFVRHYDGQYIAAANEAGAVSMALGYALLSNSVAVSTVTQGPALLNTVTALAEGVKGSVPIVLLCGDTADEDRDNLQNISQREFIIATGAGFEQLRSANTVAQDVATSLRRAVVERRPIALNMPVDIQLQDTNYEPIRYRVSDNRTIVSTSNDLDNAVGIIAAAKRPIVIAGRGASSGEARNSLLNFACRIDALLATTLKSKDLFRGEDFNLGIFGTLSTPVAVEIIMESDCIIAFGASLNKMTTSNGAFLRGKRIIQINLEQTEVGKNVWPDAGLVGDPTLMVETLIHWLDEADIPSSGYRSEEIKQKLRSDVIERRLYSEDGSGKIDIRRALFSLNEIIPADRILISDAGRFLSEAWRVMSVSNPRSFINTANFGSIGLGLSHGIGASFASNGRPTVVVSGDGGFMLGGLTEFGSAVRHKCDLILIICNDGCYGAELSHFGNMQIDPDLAMYDWPDFAPVAIALGGNGITVRSDQDLENVAYAIRNRNGPLLIDLKLDANRITTE